MLDDEGLLRAQPGRQRAHVARDQLRERETRLARHERTFQRHVVVGSPEGLAFAAAEEALAALEETRPFGIEDYELAACEG